MPSINATSFVGRLKDVTVQPHDGNRYALSLEFGGQGDFLHVPGLSRAELERIGKAIENALDPPVRHAPDPQNFATQEAYDAACEAHGRDTGVDLAAITRLLPRDCAGVPETGTGS